MEECWAEVDGVRIRYLRAGSGPPLILLHGLLGYAFSWRFTMPALAVHATVIAPDMPGAGFSDRPRNLDCTMQATARLLLRFVEELGISSCDLLGTSHGGAVAMMAAAECQTGYNGPRVRHLILVAPVNPYSPHGRRLAPFLGGRIGSTLFRFAMPLFPFTQKFWLRRMFGDPRKIPADSLAGYQAPLAIPGLFEHGLSIVQTWTADLRALEAALPKLSSVPTLLVWGERDGAVYASSAGPLAKWFPDSRTVLLPGVGHLPYEECPEEFNRVLIQFLEGEVRK